MSIELSKALLGSKLDVSRQKLARTKELGNALTGDMLARNRRVIETIGPRNPSPHYDELFLTFLDSPEWIGQADHELRQLHEDLLAAGRPKYLYTHFIDQLARDPIGRLFELSVYSILRRRFPTVPFPRLQGGKKLADMQVTIDAQTVAIEVTVLGESDADRTERLEMQALGRNHWVGSKDIDAEPRRLLRKLVGELSQTSPIMPNIIMAAIHMPATVSLFYEGAVRELFSGVSTSATQVVIDADLVARLDSVMLCSRRKLNKVLVNPSSGQGFGVKDSMRERLISAFDGVTFRIR